MTGTKGTSSKRSVLYRQMLITCGSFLSTHTIYRDKIIVQFKMHKKSSFILFVCLFFLTDTLNSFLGIPIFHLHTVCHKFFKRAPGNHSILRSVKKFGKDPFFGFIKGALLDSGTRMKALFKMYSADVLPCRMLSRSLT